MFLGLWRFTGQGGVALSPLIFAALAPISYGASFLFVGASGGIVAFLVAFRIPETGGKKARVALARDKHDQVTTK
jgi:hypothetical protein